MRRLIADTLELWREAERVLGELPQSSPDHETVALLVSSLRDLHAQLSAAQEAPNAATWSNGEAIDEARELLVSVRARHATESPAVAAPRASDAG
jgi:hypothetical protein